MNHQAWAGSRQGAGRGENQDAFGMDPNLGLYVLSDGMGGHAGGAQAARAVVQGLLRPEDPGSTRAQKLWYVLRRRVRRAHQEARELASRLSHEGDMGATLVCLWLNQGSYFLAAVGDSRGYLLRGGRMIQISEDHTVVAGLLRRGMISPQEARVHPRRNVLSQAMGVGEVEPDFFQGGLEPGDRFLLVSDGVSDLLSREELGYYLGRERDPERAGRTILEQVAERHGSDDATVLVVCAQ